MAEEVTTGITVTTTTEPEREAPFVERLLLTTALVLETISACILDIFCVVAIIRGGLHKEENRFIFMIFLSLGEMFTTLVFTVQFLTGKTYFFLDLLSPFSLDTSSCMGLNYLSSLAISLSVIGLLLLNTDQWMRIEFSLKYHAYATKKNVCILISVGSIYAILNFSALVLASFKVANHCDFVSGYPHWYYFYGVIAYTAIPVSLVSLMNGRIWYISIIQYRRMKHEQHLGHFNAGTASQLQLQQHKLKDIDKEQRSTPSQIHLGIRAKMSRGHRPKVSPPFKRHWKSTITVVILVGSLFLCWTPATVCMGLTAVGAAKTSHMVMGVFTMIVMANYVLTPIVYIVRVPEVKRELKKIFQRCC